MIVAATDGATLSPEALGEVRVTRDMHIIRRVLLEIQARKDLAPRPVSLVGEDDVVVGRHVEMLHDAGFLHSAQAFQSSTDHYKRIFVKDLSWAGHDFIAVLVNDTVWGRITAAFSPETLATMPLTILRDLGMEAFKDWGREMIKGVIGGG